MTQPKSLVLLTPTEQGSSTWQKIQAHLRERIASLREKNDGALSLEETSRVRGQIAEVKALLALGE